MMEKVASILATATSMGGDSPQQERTDDSGNSNCQGGTDNNA